MRPWLKNHNKTSECQNKWKTWVKSNLKGEENRVRPLRHIPAQHTREGGGLLQPRPCRLNYFPNVDRYQGVKATQKLHMASLPTKTQEHGKRSLEVVVSLLPIQRHSASPALS